VNDLHVERALISVWDKTGLLPFARRLVDAGVEIVSSGGTARTLEDARIPVTRVTDVTGAPEILGGRVKTLHPKIHGGILADLGEASHQAELAANDIAPFHLVVVNLYPFEQTVAAPDVNEADAIEKIDIGGPAMVRAAAKNHSWVGIVTDPAQYDEVIAAVETTGLTPELRRRLAGAAFFRTAAYDAAIVDWFDEDGELPTRLVLPLSQREELRYGENPQQAAAIYERVGGNAWWQQVRQIQGKEMSFNNYADVEAAWRLVNEFAVEPAAVIVKHTNACGAAVCDSPASAFRRAWDCDPLSAFGSVVALNRPLDAATAEALTAYFVEVVIVPDVGEDARAVMSAKRNLRLLAAPVPAGRDLDLRRIEDGFLVQVRDEVGIDEASSQLPFGWEVVSGGPLSSGLLAELEFAWTVVAHTKSNAIVISQNRAAVGVGAGDQSRVGAAERAVVRAGERAKGGVAASDAFLPFRDGLDTLADAGVIALVEPGGSKRDDEVIAAARQRGMTLVLTGRRHFRH